MRTFWTTFATAIATVLGDRLLTSVAKVFSGWEGLGPEQQAQAEVMIASQAIAAVIFRKYGLSGVATAYDYGLISQSDFALYVVANDSYRGVASNDSAIQKAEERAGDSVQLYSTFSSLDEACTDPDTIRKVYFHLLSASAQF